MYRFTWGTLAMKGTLSSTTGFVYVIYFWLTLYKDFCNLEVFPPGVFSGFFIYFTMDNACFQWFPCVCIYCLVLLLLIADFFFKNPCPIFCISLFLRWAQNVGCFVNVPCLNNTLECSYNLDHVADLWYSQVMWRSGIPSKYDYIKQRLSSPFATPQNIYCWGYSMLGL